MMPLHKGREEKFLLNNLKQRISKFSFKEEILHEVNMFNIVVAIEIEIEKLTE